MNVEVTGDVTIARGYAPLCGALVLRTTSHLEVQHDLLKRELHGISGAAITCSVVGIGYKSAFDQIDRTGLLRGTLCDRRSHTSPTEKKERNLVGLCNMNNR